MKKKQKVGFMFGGTELKLYICIIKKTITKNNKPIQL